MDFLNWSACPETAPISKDPSSVFDQISNTSSAISPLLLSLRTTAIGRFQNSSFARTLPADLVRNLRFWHNTMYGMERLAVIPRIVLPGIK